MATLKGTIERDKFNTYRRETYQWRKEHHICVRCGRENAFGNMVRCPKCLEYAAVNVNDEKRKVKMQEKVAEGICKYCANPVYDNKTMCLRHLILQRMYNKIHRMKHPNDKYCKA